MMSRRKPWMESRPRIVLALGAAGFGYTFGYLLGRGVLTEPDGRKTAADWVYSIWGLSGAIAAFLIVYLLVRRSKVFDPDEDSVESRLSSLNYTIRRARADFDALEDELSTRQRLLEQLSTQATEYKALAELHEEQAKAVDEMVGRRFRDQGRTAWRQLAISLIGAFILGALAPDFVEWVGSWWGG